jgi:gamma-butyrobetaine dioxygenase
MLAMADSAPTLAAISVEDRTVTVRWTDGHAGVYHAVWLRDSCQCPACGHPETGQRLLETGALPADLRLATARVAPDGALDVVWAADGHASRFSPAWLRHHCYCEADRAARRPRPRTWRADGRAGLPEARHADVAANPAALAAWLADVETYGFARLRDVPTVPGEVTRVAERFGFVRETNYGRLFDVRSVLKPNNLAYTGLALSGHTDNPYRDPTPTLQLLHCLASSAEGGDSTLVDAFALADELRRKDPAAFEALARVPVRFRFADKEAELEAEHPILTLDARGDVVGVRLNNRAKQPLDAAADVVGPWYAAYRAFVTLAESPAHQIRFKLGPGDLVCMDNLRMLHGRTAFAGTGERHLQGCYADIDALRSTRAVLSR